jgi:hypothetical protein
MIRFVLKKTLHNEAINLHTEELKTIDIDVPALEEALKSAGSGPDGYDMTEFVGLEVLEDLKPLEYCEKNCMFYAIASDKVKKEKKE